MSSSNTNSNINPVEAAFVTYYPLVLVIVGTILNLLTFVILCRAPFRDTRKQPTMHYMRAIALFDILMLYGWNLDHYLSAACGYTLISYSMVSCKLFSFLNYLAAQSSAWLRVFVSLDRYLSLSDLHRTKFCRSKSILIIITSIITILSLLNLPLLIYACYYRPDGTISIYSHAFRIYPLWDYINLGVYNCAPFLLMVIFNSCVIYQLINLHCTTMIQNTRLQHRSVTITLVITTFLFSIMTIPGTVAYAFFAGTAPITVLHGLDSILYTYHITSFPLYMLTFGDFRREFIKMIKCSKNNRTVVPAPAI
jgi:hypothetical protein